VLAHRFAEGDERTLLDVLIDEFHEQEDPEAAAEQTLENLGETLRTGDFALVLAAPTIPAGVQRVMEYLNARGSSLFGLEVSYFAGEVEVFVPRVVVRPTLGVRIAGQDSREPKAPVDAETYLTGLPEAAREPVKSFIDEVEGLGAELQWRGYGPRVRVHGPNGPKVMVSLDSDYLYLTVGPRKGFDPAIGAAAANELSKVRGAKVGPDYGSVRWSSSQRPQLDAALRIARAFVRDLSGAT
jgi:hypothetical protein